MGSLISPEEARTHARVFWTEFARDRKVTPRPKDVELGLEIVREQRRLRRHENENGLTADEQYEADHYYLGAE